MMFAHELLRKRGYHAPYRDGEVNYCPGCGKTHWIIGRLSAECAFCSTALPLVEATNHGNQRPVIMRRNNITRLIEAA
jgi:hypothetical protein